MARDYDLDPVDQSLVEAVLRLAIPGGIRAAAGQINGCLIRWPDDAELVESIAKRIGGGQPPRDALRAAFIATMQTTIDRLDRLPDDALRRRARFMLGVAGLDGQGAWLALPARIEAVESMLGRDVSNSTLTDRVHELEEFLPTCAAVVEAIAEVLASKWGPKVVLEITAAAARASLAETPAVP